MAGTIADKVQAILDAKADIAAALAEKHAVVPEKFSEYGDAIRAIPQNEAPNPQNPIKFVDYDGTLLYSYGVQEVLNMTSDDDLPELPERTGLTNQGWNYTLAHLQEQARTIGKAIVGCNYITSDGNTRFYITIRDPKFNEFRIGLGQTATQGFTIDWGDGSSVDGPFGQTTYAVRTHAYSPSSYPASYVITLTPQGTGKPSFVGAIVTSATQTAAPSQNNAQSQVSSLGSMFDKIELGDIGQSLGTSAFRWLTGVKTINIPKCVTTIGTQSLGGLDAAKGLIIPSSVTTLSASAFAYNYATEMISLPPSITDIPEKCFYTCTALMELVIPYTVTTVGKQAFQSCSALQDLKFPSAVSTIDQETFSGCAAMPHCEFIGGVPNLAFKAFYGCNSLKEISLTSSVTTVSESSFQNCSTLQRVAFPGAVTLVGANAFASCYGLRTIDLTGVDAFIAIDMTASSNLDITFQDGTTHIYVSGDNIITETSYNTRSQAASLVFKQSEWDGIWLPTTFVPTGDPSQTSDPTNIYETWFLYYSNGNGWYLASQDAAILFPLSGITTSQPAVDIAGGIGSSTVSSYTGSITFTRGPTGVPTLANTNAFSNNPSSMQIVVKDSSYDAFIDATTWKENSVKSHITKESEA